MSKEAEFKVPTLDPKVFLKSRRADLPRTASKVTIPLPIQKEPESAETVDKNVPNIPPVPYKEPTWSQKCHASREYSFEVEKNGVIIAEVKQLQSKPFWLFGRLPNCDVNITHPTSSRYHAVLQYRPSTQDDTAPGADECNSKRPTHVTIEQGWYLYDLNSTHGTFLNKQQITPRTYVRVRVGYMIKLGSSSRTYILQGPSDDEDKPSASTITEVKEQARKQKELREQMAEIERQEKERVEKLKEAEGISWGMSEDADEETDLTENPYATSNNEELFLDDPKKTLRGYFEREGHELEYKVDELSSGTYCCKVELPIDDPLGRPIVAEVTHKGKKKEVVLQCALEACRLLDRHGLLRQANHEPRRRHRKQSDSDDDDEFLDRTGAVEKRRQRKQSKQTPQIRTYTDLIHDEARILERLEAIEDQIQNTQLLKKQIHLPENVDDVDKFLENLSKDKPIDKFMVRRLRLEQADLRDDLETVKKLIKVAKPMDLESIGTKKKGETSKQKMMPLFGKRNKLSKTFGIRESSIRAEKDGEMEVDNSTDKLEAQSSSVSVKHVPTRKTNSTVNDGSAASKGGRTKRSVQDESGGSSQTQGEERPGGNPSKTSNYEGEEERNNNSGAEHDEQMVGKKKRPRHRVRDNRGREAVDYDDADELASDEKNIEWLPPSGQTGDGRTSLNEKYGY